MKNKIIEFYDGYDEENRLFRARESKVEFFTTTRYLDKFLNKSSKVLEIGCGTGIYGLHYAKSVKAYTGIDISPRNIEVFKQKIAMEGFKNVKAELGDALDLKNFKDESFDIVLLLGPMYHINHTDNVKCLKEAKRVCKKNGVVAIAYKSKFGNFIKLCSNENFVGRYPNQKIYTAMMFDNTDDEEEFFFTTPEEIEKLAKNFGLKKLYNVATDGVTRQHHRIADYRDEEFQLWLKFHFLTCEEPSLLGVSDNGLLICERIK